MAINMIPACNVRSHRNSVNSCRWAALLGLWYLSGCSLQGFDYLSKSNSSAGGSDQFGGSTSGDLQGGAAATGGAGGVATGGAHTGGAATGGAATGGAHTGGAATGGISSGGTLSSSTASFDAGPDDLKGCAFSQTAGKLLVPPSQGFETDLGSWTTTSGVTSSLSRLAGNGNNCEGSFYMHCDGAKRTANWEAPSIEVVSLVTLGHNYQLSVAAREVSASSSAPTGGLKLTYSILCTGLSTPFYADPLTVPVNTNWVRLTAQILLAAPSGCTTPVTLTSVRLYVATTDAEKAAPYVSIDVDDFKLIDLTASGTPDGG